MNKHLALEEKLSVLKQTDSARKWDSLDDLRVCILCNKVITGRMVDIWQDKRGIYQLHCPTPSCPGAPRDWFYHGPMRTPSSKLKTSQPPVIGLGPSLA